MKIIATHLEIIKLITQITDLHNQLLHPDTTIAFEHKLRQMFSPFIDFTGGPAVEQTEPADILSFRHLDGTVTTYALGGTQWSLAQVVKQYIEVHPIKKD